MPYCMYLRKSRADNPGDSLEVVLSRHEQELLRVGQKLGLSVTQIYREVVSGETIAARPEMQKLLSAVESGAWEGVLVMEVERLARGDTIDQGIVAQAFQFSNTKIITPIKIYDPQNEYDEEYFEFALFMSRREYKTINRRQQRGRTAAVQEGKWPWNSAPYGYDITKLDGARGFTLTPNPAHAAVVQRIYRWYTGEGGETLGVSRIVRRLNELKIPSPSGRDWVPASVRGILSNPVYAGFVKKGARPSVKHVVDGKVVRSRPRAAAADVLLVRGLHPALVPQAQYERAAIRLRENPSRPGPKQADTKNPLAGLVYCAGCGRAMVRRPNLKGSDTFMCAYTSCTVVSSPLDEVEAALLSALHKWYAELCMESEPEEKAEQDKFLPLLDAARTELKNLEAQKKRAYELVEQGIYTTEVFLERSADLAARISAAQQRISALEADSSKADASRHAHLVLVPKVRHVLDAYPLAQNAQEKNDLLKSVLQRVEYLKTERSTKKHHADFSLTLYPRTE